MAVQLTPWDSFKCFHWVLFVLGFFCFYSSILTPIGSPLGSLMVDGVIVLADVLPFSMLSQAVV